MLPLGPNKAPALIARAGDDTAILPAVHRHGWFADGGWERREARDNLTWYVFDDRQLYRPGEEVRIKGWIRLAGAGPTGDIRPLSGVAPTLRYTLQDPQGNEIGSGEAPIDATFGAFDLSLALPPTMSLGWAQLELKAGAPEREGGQHTHGFQVQEFRRPEFEARARATDGPHFVGGHAGVTATATYFAGGALPDSRVSWHVTSSTTSFTPPNRGDFHFGTWVPWWQFKESSGRWHVKTYEGMTDAAGNHRLRIDFETVRPPVPALVRATANIEDVNRQSWGDSAELLVHPADLYVGLRSDRAFVQKGEALGIDVLVTDLDGRAIGGRAVAVRSERIEWVWDRKGQKWVEKRLDTRERAITSTDGPQRVVFETPEGGTYRVTASVVDEHERLNQTDMSFWVAGGRAAAGATTSAEVVTLVPNKKEYRPGEIAEILVVAPFSPAEGLLTLRRSGILRTERFTMTGSSHTLRIPIEKGWIPNVAIHVDLVGAATRSGAAGDPDVRLPKRPAFAAGEIELPIPPFDRTLAVAVTPRENTLEPGGRTTIDLQVKDAQARPVADSEAAVVMVDEAILSLVGYAIPDPLGQVYAHRPAETSDHHLRQLVVQAALSDEEGFDTLSRAMAEAIEVQASTAGVSLGFKAARSALLAKREASGSAIRLRSDFNPLAHFSARVRTDAEGRAVVPIQLPDNLTRYRITVVAATSGAQFGKGESTLTARLPLMARPSPPRFLNFGDEAEVPVLIQNQTDGPVPVAVALRGANVDRVGAAGFRATVPAQDRVEVRFPVKTIGPGTARLQVVAVSGAANDAAEVEFPVWTPATTEAFATYGQIDGDGVVVQPVEVPQDAVPRLGGLELTTSSTALQALTDAFLYLVTYPFECTEQIASRLLAVVALRDVLTAFAAEGLAPTEELVSSIARDVTRLEALQDYDGGFGFWRQGDASWPYLSIHAAHALQRAREQGFHVPDEMLERSRRYLRKIDDHIPKDCDAHVRRTLMAYALYVRHRMEDLDTDGARTLVQEKGPEGLSFEALGWLLPVLTGDASSEREILAIRRHLANSVTETTAAAHFADSYEDRGHLLLHSDRRADAVLLEALIGDEPSSDLIPKLVQGLLGHRKKGRWSNTQENAFVLLALDLYFRTYEKASPDFVARAWLGDNYAGEHAFRGRSADRNRIDVPMGMLLARGRSTELVLAKEGAGRLYYRIGMQYAPANLRLGSMDRGFTVERRYEGADAPSDVRRDRDGTWRVRAGCRVRVRVTLLAPASRHHVTLVDPVPAGLEPLNPELAAVGSLPEDRDIDEEERPWIRWWRWFEHQNLRDERVEAFTSLLPDGIYTYSYVARATTPGRFVVPPPRAEEMYEPETFGRGRTDFVLVE